MSITLFDIPIPIIVIEKGVEIEGFALYVESGGPHSNDIWTVAHGETGIIRHYTTKQLRYPKNQTFYEQATIKEIKKDGKSHSRRKTIRGSRKSL